MNKNNLEAIEKKLKAGKKMLIMIAPAFLTDFKFPDIIHQCRKLGFDKVTEVTFGAKLINKEYHKKLEKSKDLVIASPCPGIVYTISHNFPELKKKLAKIDSPVVAQSKVCRKEYPKHDIVFLCPCEFKKIEAAQTPTIDWILDFDQLKELLKKNKIKKPRFKNKKKIHFDKFYNDYTKIYPLSGGLSETAQVRKLIKKDELLIVDGIVDVMEFLKKPDPKLKFVDCLFCKGGCIGGPHTTKKLTIPQKNKVIRKYREQSKRQAITEDRKGLLERAEGLSFTK